MIIPQLIEAAKQARMGNVRLSETACIMALLPQDEHVQAQADVKEFMKGAATYLFKGSLGQNISSFTLRFAGLDCHVIRADVLAPIILVSQMTFPVKNGHDEALAQTDDLRIG